MNIIENFKSAIFNILSSKMRTVLTTLGIIIGITSVVIITSIGKGFENKINNTFDGINSDTITISNSYDATIRDKDKLTIKDANDLRGIDNIISVSPSYSSNATVKLKNPSLTKSVSLDGVDKNGKDINKVIIEYGRFIEDKDIKYKSKICVIDENIAKEIFGRKDVIGEKIKTKTVPKEKEIELEIVGVYKKEQSEFYTPQIYIPINTLMEETGQKDDIINSILLKVKDNKQFEKTKKQILRVLTINHNNKENKYNVSGNFALVDNMKNTIKIFTVFIGFVAAISLLVGGIGVMNIMLVTVTERTREIGIRKSLGATNFNIKMQFLIEAITISMLGGVIGVVLGYIGSFMVGQIMRLIGNDIKPMVSVPVVIGAVLISSFIGIIFGVYPAGKAAKLDPIECLRYE